MTVRRSTVDDAEGFRQCLDSVCRERRWLVFLEAPSLEDVREFLAANQPQQFVAEHGGKIVGWCDVTPKRLDGFRHSGSLGMGLLPAYRGQGLGLRLLRETVDAALEGGLTRIELEVFASNEKAIVLYERFGFVHEGRKRNARFIDGRYDDIVFMSLLR